MRLALEGGAYAARSVIANAQRCLNLFPEKNRSDAPVPFTYYQRPGLALAASSPLQGPGRGLFHDSQGNCYAVVGQTVYSISATLVFTEMGVLSQVASTPCSISDNGTNVVLGDGSPQGYTWLAASPTTTFAPIEDPTGTFSGTIKWDVNSGFLLWVFPFSNDFGSTYDNELTFDPTYFGSKNIYPDPLVTLLVNRNIIILFGTVRSEIWYNAGNPLFPFAIEPGAYIEWGCAAPYSVGYLGIVVLWLGQNKDGESVFLAQEGYATSVISNHAISFAMDEMRANGANLADAVAYTYIQGGHLFYVVNFISGNQTWVYDLSIRDPELAWHQRGWTDSNGMLNRERPCSHVFFAGQDLVQDWQTGDIYTLQQGNVFDEVFSQGGYISGPVQFTRTFSQIKEGFLVPRGPVLFQRLQTQTDGHGIVTYEFTADFECGNGPQNPIGTPPQVGLRWSTDRGKTWGNAVLQSAGELGSYSAQPKWPNLGYARYPLFELSWSGFVAALNGAWIEPLVTER